jgi:hypothetical protein
MPRRVADLLRGPRPPLRQPPSATRELLADASARDRLGERARSSAQSLTWEARGPRLAAFLESLR